MPPLAALHAVGKRYGDTVALQDVDFEVHEGEVLGLLGPNGAGKTTAVRILCGLLEPDTGRAEIAGFDLATQGLEAKRRLGFVPDGSPLYAQLSPRQHLTLVGRLHGMDQGELETESERLLDALDLTARADDAVGQFSHGMRQKTGLACALLPRPVLLVLDEPLSGLDAPTTAVVKEVLRAWAERGSSVLYTSHLLDVVERVCDRMVILDHGRTVATGTLDELRAQTGHSGSLDAVFRAVTHAEDPAERARRILGG